MITSLALAAAVTLAQPGEGRETSAPKTVDAHPRNRLTFGPAPLLLGRLAVEYERAVSRRVSLFAGPHFSAMGAIGAGARDLNLSMGARLFVIGRAPHGLWIGSEIVPAYSERRRSDRDVLQSRTTSVTGLGTLGGTLTIGPLTSSAGIGGGLAWTHTREGDGSSARAVLPALSLHLNTGVTF